jgi:prepilin-type N-terminal cleavage/methylation domain-containing protein
MSYNRLTRRTARQTRGGFTLVELLVVIGIIAILAGVALGPITRGIRKAQESAAMQSARSIGLSEFSYSNDNNNIYPDGQDASVIAQTLITGQYISDPGIFIISGDNKVTKFSGTGNIAIGNVSYDFAGVNGTGGATSFVGVSSSAPDQTPLVWNGGEVITWPTGANAGFNLTPSGNGPFGKDGIAVFYKSNSAFFKTPNANANVTIPPVGEIQFIDPTFTPTTGTTYATRTGGG